MIQAHVFLKSCPHAGFGISAETAVPAPPGEQTAHLNEGEVTDGNGTVPLDVFLNIV
jgi:hypothetical protein